MSGNATVDEVDTSTALLVRPGAAVPAFVSKRATRHVFGSRRTGLVSRTELEPNTANETESIAREECARLIPILDDIHERIVTALPSVSVSMEFRLASRTSSAMGDEANDVLTQDAFLMIRGSGHGTRRWVRRTSALQQLAASDWGKLIPQSTGRVPRWLQPQCVVLSPAVAGVLIHELVGHSIEEDGVPRLDRLLPAGTTAVAFTDRPSLPPTVLVEDGRFALEPTSVQDRPRSLQGIAARLMSHCHRAPHGLRPQLRLTRIAVTDQRYEVIPIPDDALICHTTSGGRYFGGFAAVEVSVAERLINGIPSPAGPVTLLVSHADLASSHFIRESSTDARLRRALGGVCVKHSEELTSFSDAPAMVMGSGVVHRWEST